MCGRETGSGNTGKRQWHAPVLRVGEFQKKTRKGGGGSSG